MVDNLPPATRWILHPFTGFSLTDVSPDLEHPFFGDATVISKEHIPQLVARVKLPDKQGIANKLETAAYGEEFQSFIAVSLKQGSPLQDANARANQIAALIGLVYLAQGTSGRTCGLVEQLHSYIHSVVMITLDGGEFGYRGQIPSAQTWA